MAVSISEICGGNFGGSIISITNAMITTDNHQVRLNFEEVELLDPDSTGACRTDYMHVTGGVSQVPVANLCIRLISSSTRPCQHCADP